jgi:hypothetical protein
MPKATWNQHRPSAEERILAAVERIADAVSPVWREPRREEAEPSCKSCGGYHDTGTRVTKVAGTDNGSDYGPICWCCLITLAEEAGIVEKGRYNSGE